jgi:nicotinamidase-related amidase
MTQAVLVIDMIKDFITGKLGFARARDIVQRIEELLKVARERGVPVIYVCDAHKPGDPELKVWGEHAMDGSEGSEVVPELAPVPGDARLKKHTYSAFFETGLHGILQNLGVEEVILVGVVTNICIQHSAADAFFRGYRVTLLEDCVAALGEDIHRQALECMRQFYGAKVIGSGELLEAWGRRP